MYQCIKFYDLVQKSYDLWIWTRCCRTLNQALEIDVSWSEQLTCFILAARGTYLKCQVLNITAYKLNDLSYASIIFYTMFFFLQRATNNDWEVLLLLHIYTWF